MLPKHYLLLLFVFYFGHINAQDTISIYYKLDEYKILDSELKKVDLLKEKLENQLYDSILIIGSTDKIGSYKHNEKLSLKRAQELFQLIEPEIITSNTTFRIFTLISVQASYDTLNRRVDVIFYSNEIIDDKDSSKNSKLNQNSPNKPTKKELCYSIDYEALSNCAIRYSINKKVEMVEIRTCEKNIYKDTLYYFNHSKNGKNKKLKLLEWIVDPSLKSYMGLPYYCATIPKKDFEKYKIFHVSPAPCQDCSQLIDSKKISYKEVEVRRIDYPSMYSLQYKSTFITTGKIKIRVPKELININDTYYSGCMTKIIEWDSSKINKKYYFSKINRTFYGIENITKDQKFCEAKALPENCSDILYKTPCMGSLHRNGKALTLNVDYIREFDNFSIPTFGLSYRKISTFGWRFTSGIGYISSLNAFALIRLNYDFFIFKLNLKSIPGTWSKPSSMSNIYNHRGAFFISTKHLVLSDFDRINYTNNSLNIGFSYTNVKKDKLTPNFYFEYGINYNLMESRLKAVFSVGVEMALQRNCPKKK